MASSPLKSRRTINRAQRFSILQIHRAKLINPHLANTSFNMLTMESPIRKACFKYTTHPLFDKTVLFLIIANSVCLAMADPLQPPNETLDFLEKIFNILFTFEMVIKMIALGLWAKKPIDKCYFSDNWNVMVSKSEARRD